MSTSMLRSRLSQASRTPSTSSTFTLSRTLHTTPTLLARSRSSANNAGNRSNRKTNERRRVELDRVAVANKPHVVLGTKPGDETKWEGCDLKKILVSEEELSPPKDGEGVDDVNAPGVKVPRSLNYGLRTAEKNLLFGHLPIVSADARALQVNDDLLGSDAPVSTFGQSQGHKSTWEIVQRASEEELKLARERANRLARLVDLRNANAKGVMHENRRRIVEAFGETREDTGRPEVQAALLTLQIRNMWTHLTRVPQDIHNRRNLRRLVHARAKVLRYLKKLDRDRYDAVLARVGVEAAAVEGELIV